MWRALILLVVTLIMLPMIPSRGFTKVPRQPALSIDDHAQRLGTRALSIEYFRGTEQIVFLVVEPTEQPVDGCLPLQIRIAVLNALRVSRQAKPFATGVLLNNAAHNPASDEIPKALLLECILARHVQLKQSARRLAFVLVREIPHVR